jgi:hypothetical protein
VGREIVIDDPLNGNRIVEIGAVELVWATARRILTNITNFVKVGAREARSSISHAPLRASEIAVNEAPRVASPKTSPKDRRHLPWEGGPSLPVSECLCDSPLCEFAIRISTS